jgi:hypothetical protein
MRIFDIATPPNKDENLMMKILAIGCICICTLVIAYVIKIYLEFPRIKPKKDKNKEFRF